MARANQTRLPNIASSIEQLDAVQATLIGLVLTDVPTRGGAYKYGYTYGATPETKSGPFSRFRRKPKHKAIETVLDPNAEG